MSRRDWAAVVVVVLVVGIGVWAYYVSAIDAIVEQLMEQRHSI